MLSDLKRVASELNRIPKRNEYVRERLGKYGEKIISKHFGSWTIFLHAAGFGSRAKEKKKDIFLKSVVTQLQENSQAIQNVVHTSKETSIAIMGDTHFPWTNQDTLTQFYTFIDTVKPKVIIQIGDLYDMFAQGRFPRSLNTYNPNQEIETGFEMATKFWQTCRKLSPLASCHQLLGNHDVRPMKKLMDKAPDLEPFFSIDKYFEFEGVECQKDFRSELIINGIVFHHGYSSRLGAHKEHNLMNTVVGHSHRGGVVYRAIYDPVEQRHRVLWELNAGFSGDATSKALGYTPQKITRWTQGFAFIDDYGPRFIPTF